MEEGKDRRLYFYEYLCCDYMLFVNYDGNVVKWEEEEANADEYKGDLYYYSNGKYCRYSGKFSSKELFYYVESGEFRRYKSKEQLYKFDTLKNIYVKFKGVSW